VLSNGINTYNLHFLVCNLAFIAGVGLILPPGNSSKHFRLIAVGTFSHAPKGTEGEFGPISHGFYLSDDSSICLDITSIPFGTNGCALVIH